MIQPLLLSIQVASVATLIALLLGVPASAVLARWRSPFSVVLEVMVLLPLVLPPTVLGYYLLIVLGERSPIGAWLTSVGLPLIFSWRGAVVAAALVALPLVVLPTRSALESVPEDLGDVARTLGRSEPAVFFTLTLPLAWRGVLAGAMLGFARALGEFGATLMVAGSIPGRTQTLPLAIFDAAQSGDRATANMLALFLTLTAIGALVVLRRLGTRLADGRRRG
jgi:molybdate transport system permease protein